jgi:type I restriction enzyme S subunit
LTLTAVTYGDFSEANIKYTVADPDYVDDLWIESGDIFIERSNTPELVGTARLYLGPSRFAVFPDLLIRVRVSGNICNSFIDVCLQSQPIRSYFHRRAKGLAGSMPKIDQPTILCCPVPFPPLLEQQQIASEVADTLSLIEAAEITIDHGLKRSTRLRQSILKRAFEGKLVPQDPNDEPASVLLEHIKASRNGDPCGKNAAKKPSHKK